MIFHPMQDRYSWNVHWEKKIPFIALLSQLWVLLVLKKSWTCQVHHLNRVRLRDKQDVNQFQVTSPCKSHTPHLDIFQAISIVWGLSSLKFRVLQRHSAILTQGRHNKPLVTICAGIRENELSPQNIGSVILARRRKSRAHRGGDGGPEGLSPYREDSDPVGYSLSQIIVLLSCASREAHVGFSTRMLVASLWVRLHGPFIPLLIRNERSFRLKTIM